MYQIHAENLRRIALRMHPGRVSDMQHFILPISEYEGRLCVTLLIEFLHGILQNFYLELAIKWYIYILCNWILTAVCSMVFSFTFNIYLDGQNIVKLLSLEMDE
jgi:hypothetical protein